MKVHVIGLGKMGFSIALKLRDLHYDVSGYDSNDKVRQKMMSHGVHVFHEIEALTKSFHHEQVIIYLMLPKNYVEHVIEQCIPYLKPKDIIIDGGNSNYNQSIKRYQQLKNKGIHFIDVGTSGGVGQIRHGLNLMVGGDENVVQSIEQLFIDLAVEGGYTYLGKPGTGHFVKMVHNGIEYGFMQTLAEGFEMLKASPFELDYKDIAKAWNHGSNIESKMMGYLADALTDHEAMEMLDGKIDDSGEGVWMIEEALKYKVSLPIITQSLYTRFKSKDQDLFSEKIVAALRKEFGGHTVYKKK
jgi:6-phosphogluconate dehydrogenase